MVERDRLTVLGACLAWCASTEASFPRYYEPATTFKTFLSFEETLSNSIRELRLTHSLAKPPSFVFGKQTRAQISYGQHFPRKNL